MLLDPEGRIKHFNPYMEQISGYRLEEVKGKDWFTTFLPKRDQKRIRKLFLRASSGIKTRDNVNPIVTKDGCEREIEWYDKILKDANGNLVGLLGTGQDITERKKAEEQIRKLSSAVEQSIDGIIIGDLEPKLMYVNDAFAQMHGYTREEMIGMAATKLHNKLQMQEHRRHIKQLKTQGSWDGEIGHIRKDGTAFLTYMSVTLLKDSEGKPTGTLAVARDITEYKRAEDMLRESEGRYKTLFQGASEGILVADIETKELKYANPAICKMLGYTEEEMKRMRVLDIHPKENLEYVLSEFEAQARGEKVLSPSIPCLRKDGTMIYADINTTKLMIDGRECNVGFFTDITKRKRIKADLENYKEKVLQAQKHAYISSIGAIVAHQVNQPLTTINMLLEKALELKQAKDNFCPPVLQRIEKSLTEAKKATSIIRKFHQYSRDPALESTTNVNVSSTVNRIILMLSERAERAKINISTKSLDDLPEVEISETALEQLFLIIIQNAIEASDGRKKHRLNIGGGFADSKIELQFSDDCCGIAPENLDKIFEPFFSTKSDSKGIGLGLDIVQQILISYGGEIRVESQFGKGATFYVILPISNTLKS